MSALENTNNHTHISHHQRKNQNIQVYVRVRPLNNRELANRSQEVVECISPHEILTRSNPDSKLTRKFSFDRTFGQKSRQVDIYTTVVAPYIEEVLAGYNCTVFAYGQTGTGKTHTMIGTENPELKSSWEDDSRVGIIPRALSHLFDELRLMDVEFSMRVSYLELYNEELIDLLSSDDTVKIRIFDDMTKKGSVIIHGLEEIPVHTKDDVYRLLETGKERRRTASTLMNAQSSRSHTVFSILVHIRENNDDGEEMLKIGKLNLVDLAGSENIGKAGSERGIRQRENVNINQSLLTLGRVITALVERTPHIPYRESKLTRLLQESLGGRTKTSIIATVSPGHKDIEETLSTLDYAHRARNIQNKPELNQRLNKKTVLKEYTEEIDRLKRDLMVAREKNGVYLPLERYEEMSSKVESQNRELNEKVLLVKALKEELAKKDSVFKEISEKLLENTNALKHTRKDLTDTKASLNKAHKALITTKRRYEEHKVIIQSQEKTEQQLTEQAQKILEATEIVKQDTEGLHKSIERRKEVEQNIQKAVTDHSSNMMGLFESMDSTLKKFQSQNHTTSQLIHSELDSTTATVEGLLEKSIQHINKLTDKCNTSMETIVACNLKYQTLYKSLNNEHKEILHEIINDIEQNYVDREKQISLELNLMNGLNEEVKLLLTNLRTNTQNLIQKHHTASENMYMCMRNSFEELLKSNRINAEAVRYLQEKIDHQKQNERDRESILKKFIEDMSNCSKKSSTNHIDMVEKCVEFRNMQNMDSTRIANTIENINEKALETRTDHEFAVKSLADECQLIAATLVRKSEQVCSMEEGVKADSVKMSKIIECFKSEEERFCKNCHDMHSQYESDISHQQSENLKEIRISSAGIQEVIQEHVDSILANGSRTKELLNDNCNNVINYVNSTESDISNCVLETGELRGNKVKTYTPSGETPIRRDYVYPRQLASTSPHERIKQRFRKAMNWPDQDSSINTTIDEQNELTDITMEVVEQQESFLNSTPLHEIQTSASGHMNIPPLGLSDSTIENSQNSSGLSMTLLKRSRQQMTGKENIRTDKF